MPFKLQSENLYYSYDIKNSHFISLNSEMQFNSQFTPENILKYTQWLENDLKTTTKQWKIVYMHRPLYCSSDDGASSGQKVRDLYEELFYKYKVDLVLTGHTHAYERMFPIYKSIIDQNAIKKNLNVYDNPVYPTHLICGTGGNKEDYSYCN